MLPSRAPLLVSAHPEEAIKQRENTFIQFHQTFFTEASTLGIQLPKEAHQNVQGFNEI